MSTVSTESFHATTVAKGRRAVMIKGPSGSGKSDLAVQLIDRGYVLVSDDQTLIANKEGVLRASAPPSIEGKMEVRGLGIIEMAVVSDVRLILCVELQDDPERLPLDPQVETIFGIDLPKLCVRSHAASAPVIVDIAMTRIEEEQ